MIFHSVQNSGHLSCKYGHFWGGGGVICISFLWPPSPTKIGKLVLWSQKMRNVLERMQKRFYNFVFIFSFKKMLIVSFWTLWDFSIKIWDEKFSFDSILLAIRWKCISGDYKRRKKKLLKIMSKKISTTFFQLHFFF